MKIKFIGTGSGKTSLKRFHSSILISIPNYNLLVDCGDSTSRALLKSEIEFNSINGIIFSHLHPDHFSGLGDLLVQMKLTGRKKQLDIFAGKNQVSFIKEYILNSCLLPERMSLNIIVHEFDSNSEIIIKNKFSVLPRYNNHLSELKNYPQYKNLSFDSYSFLFTENEKKVIYTGDIGKVDDLYLFKENKIDLFISESTHISVQELITANQKLNPGKTILTHISDDDETALRNENNNVKNESNIDLAFDGYEIEL